MVAVHPFVAEVLADFIHTLKAANDEALQIKLGGDTHIHIHIEGVEVGDKRACTGTAGDALESRCFHLGVAGFVEHAAKGAEHGGALQEDVFHAVIDDKVHVALAIAQLRVVEGVVGFAVFHLDDRQRTKRLAQQLDGASVYGDFTHLSAKHETLDAHKVADVEELFEKHVVGVFVFTRAEVVAADIHLDAPFGVL